MLGKQEWYNREGGRWVSVMTITTKHEHSNRNLEHTGARAHHCTPLNSGTTYHKSEPHQNHERKRRAQGVATTNASNNTTNREPPEWGSTNLVPTNTDICLFTTNPNTPRERVRAQVHQENLQNHPKERREEKEKALLSGSPLHFIVKQGRRAPHLHLIKEDIPRGILANNQGH